MKQIFAMDHYHYACWGTVHFFDLITLMTPATKFTVIYYMAISHFENGVKDFQKWFDE